MVPKIEKFKESNIAINHSMDEINSSGLKSMDRKVLGKNNLRAYYSDKFFILAKKDSPTIAEMIIKMDKITFMDQIMKKNALNIAGMLGNVFHSYIITQLDS
jgi:hypothetical protein